MALAKLAWKCRDEVFRCSFEAISPMRPKEFFKRLSETPEFRNLLLLCVFLFLGAPPLSAAGLSSEPAASAEAAAPAKPQFWLTFGLDRLPQLQGELLGNPAWQYVAFAIYVLLALCASKITDYLFLGMARRAVARTKTDLDDLVVQLVRGPVKIVVFVVLLHLGLRLFAWPDWAAAFISNGLKIVVASSLTYIAIRIVDLLLGVWQQRAGPQEGLVDRQLFPIIRKTAKIFVVVVAVLVTTQNLGMNVTGLLASLSIGGLAVGLAAQDTLSNLFGAIAIFGDKPFRVGDRIQLETIDGTVEAIGLRSTRVRNLDGHLVTVPNRTMANANIINVSKRPNIKTVMNIGVTYDTPSHRVERAIQLIEEVFRAHPKTGDLIVSFNKFESASLNILVVHWWASTDFREYLQGVQGLNLTLKRRFDEEGLSFAFPTQTLYVRQDSQWQLERAAAAPNPSAAEQPNRGLTELADNIPNVSM